MAGMYDVSLVVRIGCATRLRMIYESVGSGRQATSGGRKHVVRMYDISLVVRIGLVRKTSENDT